ncbi:unnamed protein product [Brassicogethes aeneus]|uniref:Uncharacterized protein n=1 Tax=Brassicogethes aeneus TaxID=1431903 RepID=A0A9P0FBY5_BRAAE|nr:unnamed protein product [Brassicogethes aeneus]
MPPKKESDSLNKTITECIEKFFIENTTFVNKIAELVVKNIKDQMEDTFKSFNDKINVLVDDNKKLQEKVLLLEQHKSTSTEGLSPEEIIQEVLQREKRKNNVIIYNVKECNDYNTREAEDNVVISRIFNYLNITISDIKPIRLGKFSPTAEKPRPVRINFNEESLVHNFIKQVKKLKNMEDFKNINVSLDRTPRQLQLYSSVKLELSNRLANGENNIRIK